MTPPPTEPSEQPTSVKTPSSQTLKFSKKRLALAFTIAGLSDAIGARSRGIMPPQRERMAFLGQEKRLAMRGERRVPEWRYASIP